MSPAERFKEDVYNATLEIGGLVNAKLRELGVEPAVAIEASEHARREVAQSLMLATYFAGLRVIPRHAGK